MDNPIPTAIILVAYLVSIYVIRKVMEGRPAYSLKGFLYLYNFIQVAVSLYISVEVTSVDFVINQIFNALI